MKQPNNAVESSNKKHNGIIGFWKFMFCILILLFHCAEKMGKEEFFESGRIGVEFFFIVSGYLMTKKALNNEEGLENIGEETTSYIWRKFKAFFPYVIFPFIISFFVKGIYKADQIANSICNLLLIDMSGVRSTTVIGQTWYISVMLISMLILYPLIRRYKKTFTNIIAPLIVIFIGGWLSHKYIGMYNPTLWTGLMYKGLLRGFFELSFGAMLYELTQKVTKKDFTLLGKILLTVMEISGFVSIFLISNIKGANGKYEFLMLLILGISIAIAFSEKTVTYKLSNNKFCYYLEKLSLPIYLNQIWIILLVDKYLKQYNFKIKLIIAVIATILISAIIMFLTEKLLNLIRKINFKKLIFNN